MALTQGNTITASDFNTLKNNIKAEVATRRGQSFTDLSATAGDPATAAQANSIISAIRLVNPSGIMSTVTAGTSLIAALDSLETARVTFAGKPKEGTNSGCASGCVGLCQGCTGGCEGCTSCTGGCKGCTSCTGGCKGCTSCTGSCKGCTGCSGGCGGCTGCSGSCKGCTGCSGSCKGCTGCSGSCKGCTGCSGRNCQESCTLYCQYGCYSGSY